MKLINLIFVFLSFFVSSFFLGSSLSQLDPQLMGSMDDDLDKVSEAGRSSEPASPHDWRQAAVNPMPPGPMRNSTPERMVAAPPPTSFRFVPPAPPARRDGHTPPAASRQLPPEAGSYV